jgi:hypothetical protein
MLPHCIGKSLCGGHIHCEQLVLLAMASIQFSQGALQGDRVPGQQGHGGTLVRECHGHRPADTLSAATDQCMLAAQFLLHSHKSSPA